MVVWTNYEGNNFLCSSQQYPNGMFRCCYTWTVVEKIRCKLSCYEWIRKNLQGLPLLFLELWLFTCIDQVSWKQTKLSCSVNFSTSLVMTQLTLEECQGGHLMFVENIIKHNIFFYDIDIQDGDFVGELARRSTEMYEININLLRYNNHICYVNDINTFFKQFRCPNCDTFIKRAGSFHRRVKSCRVKIGYITFFRRVLAHWEKLCSINLTVLELDVRKVRNCLKTWLYLISNQSASHLMN